MEVVMYCTGVHKLVDIISYERLGTEKEKEKFKGKISIILTIPSSNFHKPKKTRSQNAD